MAARGRPAGPLASRTFDRAAAGRPVVQVFADGQPVAGADVLARFPDGTEESGRTDARGRATPRPASRHLPLTVLVAGEGIAAHLEPAWIPDERALRVGLNARPGGGSAIAEQMASGSRIEVAVSGKATIIDLVEGERRILELDAAEGARPARSGRRIRGGSCCAWSR